MASSRARKDLLLMLAGRASYVAGGLVTLRVATSLLNPEDMGAAQQLLSIAVLSSSLFVVNAVNFSNRKTQTGTSSP